MTIENADRPAPTQQAPDWISLARDAYTASTNYFDANIRHQIESDLRQAQGLHPSGSKYLGDKSRSRLFRPKTRATIRKNEAAAAEAFFTTNDVVSVKPENDNDPIQAASAAVMGELLQYRLTKTIPWYLTLVGAFQDAQTVGLVASYQYWEFNQRKGIDRPAIRLIPIENIRFDPAADWTDPVGTSPYLIELIPMYVGRIKGRMRNIDPKTGEPKWRSLPDSVIMTATKSYGDTIRQQRENNRADSKYEPQANSNYSIAWVHKNIVEIDEIDYVYYTLGAEHLLSDPVPLDQAYFHGRRPYVIGTSVVETHKNYPSSLPRLTRDVQAEINEVTNQRIDNVKLALNKRYFARRNKQVDLRSVTRNVPGSVTLMQDVDDVKVVEFNDVTQSSYKEQEMLNLDFDDVAGAFSGASVQSNRKLNETVGGMNMLSASANQVSNYQLRTFVETWVEPVLRQLILLEQHYETDETLLALCGEAAEVAQKFGVDAITDELLLQEFTLNVSVGLGQTNPAEQAKQFMQGMTSLRDMLADGTLMKMGLDVQEAIKEIFGKLGYKDGGRFFNTDKQDPMIAQLQQQISDLQAALDAKMPPELLQATVKKLLADADKVAAETKSTQAEAVKRGVEASFSAMQAAEVIAAVPAVAPIADELMRSAGYVQPNPAGIDPNFPQPAAPVAPDMPPTDPGTVQAPNPATPGIGVRQGIQTQRPDSIAAAAYANGGLIDDEIDPLTGLPSSAQQAVSSRSSARQIRSAAMAPADSEGAARADRDGNIDALETLTKHGGKFVNGAGQTDYLQNYNLSDMGLAPNALNNSPVHDLMAGGQINGNLDQQGPLAGLLGQSAFNNRFADGGLIQGPGTGTSDSIAATAEGQPLAVSNGEYHIPSQVVAALGQDFFDKLIEHYHTPVAGGNGAMPLPANAQPPLPMDNGDFIVPADVVQALGRDFFDKLVESYGAPQA
jgi:hypothetical protein